MLACIGMHSKCQKYVTPTVLDRISIENIQYSGIHLINPQYAIGDRMDQRCRRVPETCEVCNVDVAVLDEGVFEVSSASYVYHESTISIHDDAGENHSRVVVRDMHGVEACACSLDRDILKVRFLSLKVVARILLFV